MRKYGDISQKWEIPSTNGAAVGSYRRGLDVVDSDILVAYGTCILTQNNCGTLPYPRQTLHVLISCLL